jgi:hypothetical protein
MFKDEKKNGYPKNKFSKYFENSNSFFVKQPPKKDIVDRLYNERCDGGIMLEPRLQEYFKKRKFNKDNNVESCITPEQEFQITPDDIKKLKAFLRGRTDIYTKESKKLKEDSYDDTNKFFPSHGMRDDPRVQKLKKPDIDNRPLNRGMFAVDDDDIFDSIYEDPHKELDDDILDARDFSSDNKRSDDKNLGFSLNDAKFNPRTDLRIDRVSDEKFDKKTSQYRVGSQETRECRKTNNTDQRNNKVISDIFKKTDNDKKMIDKSSSALYSQSKKNKDYNLLEEGDKEKFLRDTRYGQFADPTFSEKSDIDTDNKVVIPKIASKSNKGLNTGDYRLTTFLEQNIDDPRDFELESSMVRGMPSNTKKSYGYRQPFENQFQYIDEEFQNPDNSIESYPRGGVQTRGDNLATAKQKYQRQIM